MEKHITICPQAIEYKPSNERINIMPEDYIVSDNTAGHRYVMPVEGKMAYSEYIKPNDKLIIITHTEVPEELEGHGIASKLLQQVLADIEAKGLQLVPLCPFTSAYVRRHPDWMRIVHPNYRK